MIPLFVATPDPYGIFERAREVWASQRYPAIVAYSVDVSAGSNGQTAHRHYHEYWSSSRDRVVVKPPVSDEQLKDPYKPSAGVAFYGWNIGGPRVGTGVRDFIGVPLVAPNYSFGISTYVPPEKLTPADIVEQVRREYHDPAPQKVSALEQQSGLKTIALISSSAHAYRIALVGIEPDEYGNAYHLALSPLHDPLRYRLRDLWIDTKTYVTDRARIGGNFTDKALESAPWIVRFAQIDGATYITSEDAEKPIAGPHGVMYAQYRVSFDVQSSGGMPPFADITPVSQPLTEP